MHILMIAYGTGGSEIYKAIYGELEKQLHLLGHTLELQCVSKYAHRILTEHELMGESLIINHIIETAPDIIINETSNGLTIQNKVTAVARASDIPIISILDIYGSYKRRYLIPPNYIIVPSTTIAEEVRQSLVCGDTVSETEYLDEEIKVLVGGNAAFDGLLDYTYTKEINRENPKILYTSQGKGGMEAFAIMYGLFFNKFHKFHMDIKPHPQEDKNWEFRRIIDTYNNVSIYREESTDAVVSLLNYDMAVGYDSTLLLKSHMLGIPTISYLRDDVETSLQNYVNGGTILAPHQYNDFEINGAAKIIAIILSIINKHK